MPTAREPTATMLTKLTVRNFKQFEDVTVELDNVVVFVGPNDSGKTTALQALALWELGLRRWMERRGTTPAHDMRRPGVTINRQDLLYVPVSQANSLWRGLRTRETWRGEDARGTNNVRIEIIVDGVTKDGKDWTCGLEFDYANPESFYCRPLRTEDGTGRMIVPDEALSEHVVFLPPMSGLSSTETMLQPGAVNVLLGEGRTAEVLRNLCFEVFINHRSLWDNVLVPRMRELFGATILEPQYNPERGEVTLRYRDARALSLELDLSSSGRGFQQTLLLSAYMLLHPDSVILLDEPDAHLEILRQRQIYHAIAESAENQNSQLLIATHSEVVLNEAGERHMVVAFVGRPHRIDGRSSQVLKALSEIGFEHYLQAETTGWVLYLEGSTDLSILQAFASRLDHPAREALAKPYVRYVGNQPMQARNHFWGLREAYPRLRGCAVYDRLERGLPADRFPSLAEHSWKRREIENYFCIPEVFNRWAESEYSLFGQLMPQAIDEIVAALQLVNQGTPWDGNMKVSEQFIDPLLKRFDEKTGGTGILSKADYHFLIEYIEPEEIDPEVTSVLDHIAEIAAETSQIP